LSVSQVTSTRCSAFALAFSTFLLQSWCEMVTQPADADDRCAGPDQPERRLRDVARWEPDTLRFLFEPTHVRFEAGPGQLGDVLVSLLACRAVAFDK